MQQCVLSGRLRSVGLELLDVLLGELWRRHSVAYSICDQGCCSWWRCLCGRFKHSELQHWVLPGRLRCIWLWFVLYLQCYLRERHAEAEQVCHGSCCTRWQGVSHSTAESRLQCSGLSHGLCRLRLVCLVRMLCQVWCRCADSYSVCRCRGRERWQAL